MTATEALPAREDDGPGVTTLELFFDLVFVFTMTQLTSMLEHGLSIETLAQVVLILVVLFWMYSGYVWLTNQVPPVTTASRLLLIAGMAGFLVCALAVPHGFGTDGVAFAIEFFVVIVVHSGMFVSAYGRGDARLRPAQLRRCHVDPGRRVDRRDRGVRAVAGPDRPDLRLLVPDPA